MSAMALTWALLATVPVSKPGGDEEPLAAAIRTIETRCFECHAGPKVKGGLRLDESSGWVEGVDKDDPADSEMIYRMALPAGDADAMPPEGDRIADATIAGVQGWIAAGADEKVIQTLLNAAAHRSAGRARRLATIAKALGAVIERARPPGGDGEAPVAYRVSWSHNPRVPTREQIAGLRELAETTIEISFAGTGVTDDLLTALPRLPALKRAHLERTQLTDAGVTTLIERAPALTYLNVHSTQVSANLQDIVAPLGTLRHLVTFNTAADTGPPQSPFAPLRGQQPRRILAVDAAERRVVLLRETSLETFELLWERPSALGLVQWLGDAPRPDHESPMGLGDGHGRVLMLAGRRHLIEVDTRSQRIVWEFTVPYPVIGFHRRGDARDEAAPWTIEDREHLPKGLDVVQVIARTASRRY